MGIEYYNRFMELHTARNLYNVFIHREDMVAKYSWAVPTEGAFEVMREYQPFIEIGAGKGYWAFVAKIRKIAIMPYDYKTFDNEDNWTDVFEGDENTINKYVPSWNLFLCWPEYNSPMAYNALVNFKGEYLCYVGEGYGGCCANDDFFEYLFDNFSEVKELEIPRWFGIHDTLSIWRRNGNVKTISK